MKEVIELPDRIKFHQIEEYSGLLTTFIESLNYPVTVIRGLRNSTDFQYELNQYRFLQDLKPDIKMVSLFCNKEFDHISSSAIKMLDKYDSAKKYLLC